MTRRLIQGVSRLPAKLRQGAAEGSKSWRQQLFELTELLLRGHVHPSEYFSYGFAKRSVGRREMALFLGNRFHWQTLLPTLNQRSWRPVLTNKWFFHLHFRDHARLPECFGLYHPVHGVASDGEPLRSAADLEALLRRHNLTSFVVKPVFGWKGQGVTVVTESWVEGSAVKYRAQDGTVATISDLTRQVTVDGTPLWKRGMIVQARVPSHPDLAALAPQGTHTIRVVAIAAPSGQVVIPFAKIKMGRAGAMVDNWSAGAEHGYVDPETGQVAETAWVDRPSGPSQPVPKVVPFWREVLTVARRLMDVTPGVNAIGWDFIVSPEGPYVIEGNDDWDVVSLQSLGIPFLRPDVVEVLNQYDLGLHTPELPPFSVRNAFRTLMMRAR